MAASQTESQQHNETAAQLQASAQSQPQVNINDERAVRRARRQAFIDTGVDPYPARADISAHAGDLIDRYAQLEAGESTEDIYSLAGRIRAFRRQGKLAFIVLEDVTGSLQLFCRRDVLGDEAWELLKQYDVGDIIGATGPVVRTRRGELSLAATSTTMLAKSCRPLPNKWSGLTDKETRYRQRYADLIVNPDVMKTFRNRSRIISAIRRYMEQAQGYIEVETPILQETLGGANARPFTTHFNALNQDCYLRIATELHLKRCIVGGMERVFEIGRQFRNEGMDQTHNPEFTSMEAYCAYSDINGMMRLTEGLFGAIADELGLGDTLNYQGQQINIAAPFRAAPMSELVSEVVGREVSMESPVESLRELCDAHELPYDVSWGVGRLIFTLYDELVEKTLVNPTFVCDYPVEVSPLAKRKPDDLRLTERFELVVAGHEYANAFTELNDPVDQEQRFQAQVAAKAAGDAEAMEYDADYVRALEYGMPPCGGVGYGIDRLVMLFCDEPSIRDVLLFPHMRPEHAGASAGATDAAAEKTNETAPAAAEVADAAPASATKPLSVPFDPTKLTIEPLFEDEVDFETFSKSDFRAVKVKECSAVPKSKKLLQFVLDDGTGEDRIILSGIHAYYEPEDLVGKTLIAITNLPSRKMMGIASCGMLLSAVHEEAGEERLNLLMVDKNIPAGAKLY